MNESKARINRKKRKRKQTMIKWSITLVIAVVSIFAVIVACVEKGEEVNTPESVVTSTPTETEEPTTIPIITDEPIWGVGDPNNDVYPYSTMSRDWGAEIYEEGFTYYEIPEEYTRYGGMFPEVAQVYLWSICRDAGVDYYTVLALIEKESGYRYNNTGDNGASKGLMQINEQWHLERMEDCGATDLYNPFDNMRVGVSFLAEIQDKYLEGSGAHCVLMVYNMGATGAKKCWDKGIYSTAYTKTITARAQEIKQELQDQ